MGGSSHTTETALAGVQVQTSLLGMPITLVWGRARISCNLVDYVAFKAIPKTTKTGGKGGSSSSTTYTYTASPIMVLCEGPITGVRTVYKDSSVFTNGGTTALAQAGLSLALGTLTQAPWGYMTSLYPSHAIGYSQLAYVYAQDYALGSGASLSNHGFEADSAIQFGPNGDADPKDIVTDYLTNTGYGVTGWTSGLIGSWADWSLYCRAANLLLSPVLDTATPGADFLSRIALQSNSEFFWSEGMLKCRPYGDTALTGNSVTWTPNLTPIYDLDETDFLEEVELEIVDQTDAYNYVSVEFLDRSNQYQPGIQTASDLDDIVTYGLRKQDAQQFHDICDAAIAKQAVQLWLQRVLYVRDRYHFKLPEDFVAIEPMDYVTLTTTVDGIPLNRQLVLVKEIAEDADGNLTIMAEGVPGQTANAATYPAHVSTGFQPNVDVDPGNVATPVIFNAPASLATQAHEVWAAVAGGANWGGCNVWLSVDNATYQQIGTIHGPARYGVLTASLASHADPDTTNTLSVDLTTSLGVLGAATHAEADAAASLCMIDSELLSYADLAVTSANHFNLTYLRRGQRGSAPAAHSSGATFVRLDDAIFKYAVPDNNLGATFYLKFVSFNLYGRASQQLSAVTAYTVGLAATSSIPSTPTGLALAAGGSTWVGSSIDLVCNATALATSYAFNIYDSTGATLLRTLTSTTPTASYTSIQAAFDGAARAYKVSVVAISAAGSSAESSKISITNAAPAAVSSPSAAGGATVGTITCTASTDPDLVGYIVFYGGATGFNPATAGGIAVGGVNSVAIYGLAAATYYCKIAAYDGWSANPSLLNLSSELNFAISTGGGSTPTGGGTGGGGYTGGGGGRGGGGTAIP
jgi:hypothetical protein